MYVCQHLYDNCSNSLGARWRCVRAARHCSLVMHAGIAISALIYAIERIWTLLVRHMQKEKK